MFPPSPPRLASIGVALIAALVSPAAAAPATGTTEVAVSPWVGSMFLDSGLGDFQWNTDPQTVWGATALARSGRFAGGARLWRGSTRQSVGTLTEPATVDVNLTGIETLAEARFASLAGVRFVATGAVGVLNLGWSPSTLDLDLGIGEPVSVNFDPIREATFATGMAVRRSLIGGFGMAVGAERTWFRMDTAHRRGTEIVNERRTFGTWTARIELSRSVLQL